MLREAVFRDKFILEEKSAREMDREVLNAASASRRELSSPPPPTPSHLRPLYKEQESHMVGSILP